MAGFPKIPKPPPPVCGDCLTMTQAAQPDVKPQQFPSKLFRAGDGKTRIDYGDTSMITDPAKQQSILLDHVKKEARVLPLPPAPPVLPGAPPPMPLPIGAPPGGDMKVEELGKAFIDGQEVEGRKYTFTPPEPPKPPPMPEPPKPPEMPKLPEMPKPPVAGLPKLPGVPVPPPIPTPPLPAPPAIPEPPAPPPVPVVTEVWTSTELKLPVLTKTTSQFGQQMCRCKYAAGAEPAASLFQIPPGYKSVTAPAV